MSKRITAISLLLLLILPIVGSFAYLQYQKATVRHKVKRKMIAGIEKEELVLLKFKTEEEKAQLRWEHSKEFEYRGQMYDVVLREQVGDSTYYHCWWDAEETALNQQLTDLTQLALNTNPERQKHQKTLYSFLQTLYFPSNYKWLACMHESSNSFISYFSNIQASIYFQPPTPPPEKA